MKKIDNNKKPVTNNEFKEGAIRILLNIYYLNIINENNLKTT
jgi:hypothetical protein